MIEVNKTELFYSGQINRNKSIFEWDHKVRFIPNILNYLLSRNIRNWENERLIGRAAILQIQIKLLNLDLRNLNRRFILKIELREDRRAENLPNRICWLETGRCFIEFEFSSIIWIFPTLLPTLPLKPAKKNNLTFSLWEGKGSFFSEWDNRAWKKDCITGALHHSQDKERGTMKIVSDLSLLTDSQCYPCSRCPWSCCWRGRRARGSTRRARWSGAGWPWPPRPGLRSSPGIQSCDWLSGKNAAL